MQKIPQILRMWCILWLVCVLSLCAWADTAPTPPASDSPEDSAESSIAEDQFASVNYDDYENLSASNGEPLATELCPEDCCQLCPCDYFWAEALVLERDNQSAKQALVLDLNTDEVLLTTGDLDFDWSGGVRIGYGTHPFNSWAWEAGYLGYFEQSANAWVELEDSLMLPDDLGLQVNNFFAADFVRVRYDTELHSVEVNHVYGCGSDTECGSRSIEWLAGLRYVNLKESAAITAFDSEESTTTYCVRARNNLYGGQLGARARRLTGSWVWEATGKAGVFANDVEQRQSPIIDFQDFEFRESCGGSDTELAFVGDVNLTAIYQFCTDWGVRMGYNLIWVEGVALAPDQFDFSHTLGSGTGLFAGSSVLLHGVNIGLEARW